MRKRLKRKPKPGSAATLTLPAGLRYNLGAVLAGSGALFLIIALLVAYMSPIARYRRDAQRRVAMQKADAFVAHQRYESGCTMPWVYHNDGAIQAIALSENVVYTDGDFGVPMAPGDLVCDDNGLSGEIGQSGYLEDPRRASDMDLVNQRFDDSMGWHKKPMRSNVSFSNSN
ncbi:hypothetical protein D0962_15370 [Leptolyngbyaceae cyanobacterium CCMR0082]|uniref:Uncharacterized protein n=1 Tax=Adonisia turfae CCMR0082 TaxID=2304604 RepID=A0A6M0S7U8_9CYAN|nr:hypothetical protein [Adonisia turfae]NEZ64153.1 hypothetical protein [Adonisia turfae CCMR0082]